MTLAVVAASTAPRKRRTQPMTLAVVSASTVPRKRRIQPMTLAVVSVRSDPWVAHGGVTVDGIHSFPAPTPTPVRPERDVARSSSFHCPVDKLNATILVLSL